MDINAKKGLKNFMQIIAFGLLLIVILGFSILPNKLKLIPNVNEGKFNTVTVETLQQKVDFKIRTVTEKYDENGKMSYSVIFDSMDGQRFRVYCNIPESYKDRLNTEAVYSGNLTLAYVKEVYDNLKDEAGNKIEVTNENIAELLYKNIDAYGLIEVNFMYKSFVTTPISTLEVLTEEFITRYKITQETA